MQLPGGVVDEQQQQQQQQQQPPAPSDGRPHRTKLSIRTSPDDTCHQSSPEGQNQAQRLSSLLSAPTPTTRDVRKREVWVGKIGVVDATDHAVRTTLSQLGSVANVTVRDPEEHNSTTWALVTFATELEASAAARVAVLDNGWEIRMYDPTRLHSKDDEQVVQKDNLRQSTRIRSLLKKLREDHSVHELADQVEQAMGLYFNWETVDKETRKKRVKFKKRRHNSYLAGIQAATSISVGQTALAAGVAIGQFLNDTSRHTFAITKSVINAPLQEAKTTVVSAASAVGSGSETGVDADEEDDEEPELDEHTVTLIETLRPILQSCLWYAAVVADGTEGNLVDDRRQRLIYVGSKDHEMYRELSSKQLIGNGHGHMTAVKTLSDALEEVNSTENDIVSAALGGAVSCIVVTLNVDADFTCIRKLASELGGRAAVYWYVEPSTVPDGLKRIVQGCGWEVVSPSMETRYAMWVIRSTPLSCCEACLQLVKRTLQRLLDRHTMSAFNAVQLLVANLFRTQPWIVRKQGHENFRKGHTESVSFAKFFRKNTPDGDQHDYEFVPSVPMQYDLLRILQLCCEGGCMDGQNILADSGVLMSVCEFIGDGTLETKVLHHSKMGKNSKHLDALLLHRQALLTVTEAIQGPNIAARNVVLQTSLHDTVATLLVRMSQTRHTLMRNYQEAHVNNETVVPDTTDGVLGRSISAVRSSTSLADQVPLGSFRTNKKEEQRGYEAGGLVARMLAKETSIGHIDMLGMAGGTAQLGQTKSNLHTRSNRVSGPRSTNPLKIEQMVDDSNEFEVELLEHVAVDFLRSCVAFSRKGDAVFAGTLGEALAGKQVYHALLSQWRFHVILGEIEKQKGVAIKSIKHQRFSRSSFRDADDETIHAEDHVVSSISRRRITMVSYWTLLDELLSAQSHEQQERLEPSNWDNNGIQMLKINRVEIQRAEQVSPYYFMSSDADETQVHLSTIGRLEHRLEAMRRSEWQDAILGTDEQTGIWDYGTKETTGQRKRNDNLDASARYWLVNLHLARKNRDPDAPPGPIESLIMWMTVHLNMMNKARLFLVVAINFIVIVFTQDRDKISRRKDDDGTLNLFHEDKLWAHNLVLYLGCVTLALSVCSAFVTVKDRRLVLLAEATIRKEEARMIHNGDFRRHEYEWMFTDEDRSHAGRTKFNCYGVVHVVKHMRWQTLGFWGNVWTYLQIMVSLEVIYCTLFVVTAVLGLTFGNPLLYCFHMLDICGFSTELKATVSAGKSYFLRVISLTVASFSVMYIYAALGFWFFPRSFIDENGNSATTSLWETLLFVLNFGFRSGGGIADVSQPAATHKYTDDYYQDWQDIGNTVTLGLLNAVIKSPPPGTESNIGYVAYTIFRFIYDLSFFIIFVLFFSNVILVVMVDGLNDYREAVDDRRREVSSHCIICSQHRDTIEGAGVVFVDHVRREHNVYMYLDLVATIVAKPLTEYTGAENYIAQCLKRGNWDFIPFKTSLCVQRSQAAEAAPEAAEAIGVDRQPTDAIASTSGATYGNVMQVILTGMQNLEHQLEELKRTSKTIEDRVEAEKVAREAAAIESTRRHEQLLEHLEKLLA